MDMLPKTTPRNGDVFEIYCGSTPVSGMTAMSDSMFKRKYSPFNMHVDELRTDKGRALALSTALALREGGLFLACPSHKTMLKPTRKSFGRASMSPTGSQAVTEVREDNLISSFITMVVALLHIRSVQWAVYQPPSSFFWEQPGWEDISKVHKAPHFIIYVGPEHLRTPHGLVAKKS